MTTGRREAALTRRSVAGEVRQDLLTGKWVVVAPGRAGRPQEFATQRPRPRKLPKYRDDCPFCNLAAFPQRPDLIRLPDDPDRWQVHIFPNKYPALHAREEFRSWNVGPNRALEAVGYHEILATRWHHQVDGLISTEELALQLEALVLRYRELREKAAVNYIQIIKNHGEAAGASLAHPHHQIFGLPVLPNEVLDLLRGVEEYARRLGSNPFDVMMEFEGENGERLVGENEYFMAFCPFASRVSFEVWIVPRAAEPYFENSSVTQREALAELLGDVLARLYVGLHDPAYNYFIYSAPCDETGFVCDRSLFGRFRWHVAVMPRLGALGGLEVSTGLTVSETSPETAAAFLREQRRAR
ncbi:MAG: hypothetical protein HY372_01800 [Candidatus Andersenbacteria bacterium]|nr:hypothetical protein [Candidatus Andersenbacteria bacterium]